MSRIGKNPIPVPSGVTVNIKENEIEVKGSKGTLSRKIPIGIKALVKDNNILVTRDSDIKRHRELHGLMRMLISNMVVGTSQGFEKKLLITGVGYRANLKGRVLNLALGYSHPIDFEAPEGINFEVNQGTEIVVKGIDKELVGHAAVMIRNFRKPEPYKGKGIRYSDEQILRKAGKTAGSK